MTHFRKNLFPIAFSHTAAALAPSVKEMAQRFDAAVVVLNAFNPVPNMFLDQHLKLRVVRMIDLSCSLPHCRKYATAKSAVWKSLRALISQAYGTQRGS